MSAGASGSPNIAIVHERFTEPGGSELVVEQLHQLWPEARVYTPIMDPAAVPPGMRDTHIVTSSLQSLYRGGTTYAHLLPLLPRAMAHFDLSGANVVITSHHAFSNRVRVDPGTRVISYTYTPARWMWDPAMRRHEVGGPLGRLVLRAFAATQRSRDVAAAQRLDELVVISRSVAERTRTWWGREGVVLSPPVDVGYFTPGSGVRREDFFLLVGRLVPYKRPEVAVEAARRIGARLVVVGDGRSRRAVEAIAGPGVELLGSVDRQTLRHLYRSCSALVFPGEEDFGMVPVEAQACGAPVIALGAGGVLDTVRDGETGLLYEPSGGEVGALAEAMSGFDPSVFDHARIRANAESFSTERFRERFRAVVEASLTPTARS